MAFQTLPTVQRAAQIHTFGEPLSILSTHPVPDPNQLRPNECLVKIEHAGVCQSDLHARNGDWGRKPTLPRIGGHEGVGIVVAIGPGTIDNVVSLGDKVGLKFIARVCLHCDHCRAGNESSKYTCLELSEKRLHAMYLIFVLSLGCPARLIHGFTVDGTFAEYAVSRSSYLQCVLHLLGNTFGPSRLLGPVTSLPSPSRWMVLPHRLFSVL